MCYYIFSKLQDTSISPLLLQDTHQWLIFNVYWLWSYLLPRCLVIKHVLHILLQVHWNVFVPFLQQRSCFKTELGGICKNRHNLRRRMGVCSTKPEPGKNTAKKRWTWSNSLSILSFHWSLLFSSENGGHWGENRACRPWRYQLKYNRQTSLQQSKYFVLH